MEREPARSSIAALALAVLALAMLLVSGCSPGVGSGCTLSTDCGTTGNLVCDTSEFEGYCTVEDCVPDQCPNSAACVLFDPEVPGCGYDDRRTVGVPFCMATCASNSNCRDGYICVDPMQLMSAPWNAMILDSNSTAHVCLPLPLEGLDGGGNSTSAFNPDAAVCQFIGPAFDASALYASLASDEDAGSDAADLDVANSGDADAGAEDAGAADAGD